MYIYSQASWGEPFVKRKVHLDSIWSRAAALSSSFSVLPLKTPTHLPSSLHLSMQGLKSMSCKKGMLICWKEVIASLRNSMSSEFSTADLWMGMQKHSRIVRRDSASLLDFHVRSRSSMGLHTFGGWFRPATLFQNWSTREPPLPIPAVQPKKVLQGAYSR